ncbi:MAG: hypothetical protein ACRDH6_05965 [Actinomycetota bacterium]
MAKRWLVATLVLALALAPAGAVAGKKKKKAPPTQIVEGGVTFPVIAPTAPETCFSGVHRRLVLAAGSGPQGFFGYDFDVDKATWNGKFVLEVTGGESVDLDIIFYPDFGDQMTVGKTVTYETRESGGETGAIPANMTKVIVCMYTGFEATFTYTGTGK